MDESRAAYAPIEDVASARGANPRVRPIRVRRTGASGRGAQAHTGAAHGPSLGAPTYGAPTHTSAAAERLLPCADGRYIVPRYMTTSEEASADAAEIRPMDSPADSPPATITLWERVRRRLAVAGIAGLGVGLVGWVLARIAMRAFALEI